MKNSKAWYANWFDSPYYHILYKNRDDKEAKYFIRNLVNNLKPESTHKLLDLACGAGRHSIYLNSLGYEVTGVDLSPKSIEVANKSANNKLNFAVHDIREIYKENGFDFILNLFTSFGYFDTEEDNIKALTSIEKTLKPGGKFVLDFFNSKQVIANLVSQEIKEVGGIVFHLTREYKEGFILKHIKFEDKGEKFSFTEKVQAFTLSHFEELFSHTSMNILSTYGDYSLSDFDEDKSERLIIIAQK